MPHPKGWASTPTGLFCVARTYCSYHTFPRTSYLSALRAEVDSIYPARKSNALLCPCPGILPRRNRALFRAKNTPGGWVHLPSLPAFLSAVTFLFVGRKPPPAAVAHKGANTAFRAFGGIRMPPHPAGGPHKPSQGRTRGSAFLGCGVQFRWAVIGGAYCDKNPQPGFGFSKSFGCSHSREQPFPTNARKRTNAALQSFKGAPQPTGKTQRTMNFMQAAIERLAGALSPHPFLVAHKQQSQDNKQPYNPRQKVQETAAPHPPHKLC